MTYQRGQRSEHVARLHAARQERSLAALRAEVEYEERQYNGRGEPEVVIGKQLVPIIAKWREDWLKQRGVQEQRDGLVMGPMDWLKEMTGMHIRRISGIAQGEFQFIPVSQADLLLTVMGLGGLLSNGTVMVIPNPNWSPERWLAYMEEKGCI